MNENGWDKGWEQLEESAEKRRQAKKQLERGMISDSEGGFKLNDAMLAAIVAIAAVISFTDFTFSFRNVFNLTALTTFLYVITVFVYKNRYEKGKQRGRSDAEYKDALASYREKREKIYDQNLAGQIPAFCTEYRKRELREYRESLLLDIEMDYEEYKGKYLRMSERELARQKLSTEAKAILIKCNKAKAIRLSPGMILNEDGEYDRHTLISQSGRERERADKKREAISRALYVLFGSIVAVDVIFNFSFVTVVQWIVRMLPVVIAIITGDDSGFCCIAVTENRHKRDQIKVIRLFNEWVAEKKVDKHETTEM